MLDKDKIFVDYNHYHDRGMMKWMTAYSMEELTSSILFNHQEALKEPALLPETPLAKQKQILAEAFFSQQPVVLQLRGRDEWGRFQEPVTTYFLGEDEGYYIFTEQKVLPEEIAHIHLKEAIKWFQFEN